jgi:hypothetical protein
MRRPLLHALAAMLLAAPAAHAATVTIVNADGFGEGFNDATPVTPVGGNPATTLGGQRMYVFQYAANLWGAILPDNVEIRVNSQFNPLTCTATAGVLGGAGAAEVYRDFPNAPFASTWYQVALANRISGVDLSPAWHDITAQFNSSLGTATCLPMGWYLGVDGNEGTQIELLPTVLHEIGHGLGFSSTTSGSTGAQMSGFPGVWDHFLYDDATGLHWLDETNAQRAASALSCSKLLWDGPAVRYGAPAFLQGPKAMVHITSPYSTEYLVGAAQFGPPLGPVGVTGQVVLVQDDFGNPTNGCENITNNVAGKIVLIDRGTCTFAIKVKSAQLAGAIGVIVADSVATCLPAAMGGVDATITIPSVRIIYADGQALRARIAEGVTATLISDPARQIATDVAGRVMMYSPNPYEQGSSVSHWDTTAEPSLLMEPWDTANVSASVDLTKNLFMDMGWFTGAAGVGPAARANTLESCVPNPVRGTAMLAYSLSRDANVDLRVYDVVGREVATLAGGAQGAGRHTVIWKATDSAGRRLPPGIYRYRLRADGWSDTRSLVVVR